jgi:hypothetical protein
MKRNNTMHQTIKNGRAGVFCFGLMLSLVAAHPVFAQTAGKAGVEGYVTDANGKPLPNVLVEVAFFTNATGAGGFTSTVTDGSGFFIMEVTPGTSEFGVSAIATCRTAKGTVRVSQPLYWTVREQVYRRDFRLTLPKKATSCLF